MRFSEDRIEKLTCSDGIQRDIHIWEPDHPRAVILTIHGLMDHGGAYLLPALFFKKHQMATVAYDQHGHDRKRKVHFRRFEIFIEDLEIMIRWVNENYPGRSIFLMGHSMGGLIVTQFGLTRLQQDALINGFVISSPYYVNAVKVPRIVQKLLGVLSVIAPRLAAPIEDITPNLTHDEAIYKRHQDDIRDQIKASKVSVRSGYELLKAQQSVQRKIETWKHPLLAIIAGDDKIADIDEMKRLLGQIKQGLVNELYYPDNYHENFNELNRDEVFKEIMKWMEPRI